MRKIFAAVFALLAIAAGSMGIYLAVTNIDAAPVLLEAPEAARQQAITLMDNLCQGNYAAAGAALYGQPELGLDRDPEDPVGMLFYACYKQSLRYQLSRDCYATDTGVALDVQVTALDIDAMMLQLRQLAQSMLEQRVADAADISEVYDENGEYRESFVMDVLYAAVQKLLEDDKKVMTIDLTLECVHDNGQWWIVPEENLLEIMGCGIGQ